MNWMHVGTELATYAWTIVCVRLVWKRGGWPLLVVLIAGGLYGFVLEYSSVKANTEYCYDAAMIMIPPWPVKPPAGDPCPVGPSVPLWISFGWMMTIYIAMQTSSRLNLPFYVRPVVDGLVGMSIDWVLDPLAVHIQFWQWYTPGPYYGVPLDNFLGWFTTIASFSLFLRLGQRWWGAQGGFKALYGAPLFAIVAGVAVVAVVMKAALALPPSVNWWILLALLFGLALLLVIPYRRRVRGSSPPDWFIILDSGTWICWYAFLSWASGLYAVYPSLILIAGAVLTFAMLGYCWPYSFAPRARTTES